MGETIRIEIPVSVNDNTDPGLSNITNKMNTLATAAQKVNRILSSGFKTRGIEQTAERVERTLGREHSIEVSADDNATPVLSRVEDAAERVEVTMVIPSRAARLDGTCRLDGSVKLNSGREVL